MNVRKIMPVSLAALIVLPVTAGDGGLNFLRNVTTCRRWCALRLIFYGIIILTVIRMRRRHGRAAL